MSEQWVDIEGYVGRYQVSTLGRVRNSVTGRILKQTAFSNGYLKVTLGYKGWQPLIHRLVAKAFIPGDHNLQVNHINGDRQDNRIENLDWLSCSDNHRHSYRELHRKRHAKTKRILLVDHGREVEFDAANHAAKFLKRNVGSVLSAAREGTRCNGYEVHHAI